MKYRLSFLFILLASWSWAQEIIYESPTLLINKIAERVFVHVSYLQSETFGLVACNGMIYMDDQDAIIFDAPTADSVSLELINWIVGQNRAVKAVVINHFHADCLGGLSAFHKLGIPSYSNEKTVILAQEIKPINGFLGRNELKIKAGSVINQFFGEAHTRDNIVSYLPNEKVLFGGCMIKSLKAGKGNLEDANVHSWSETVANILKTYPDVQIVIPGHGAPGNKDLLVYTIDMFDIKK